MPTNPKNTLILLYTFRTECTLISCDSWRDLSAYGIAQETPDFEDIDNHFVTFKEGQTYTKFLDIFKRDIPQENIRLNTEVESVELVGEGDRSDFYG